MQRKTRILRIFSRLNIGGPSFHVVNLSAGLDPEKFETQLVVGKAPAWEGDLTDYAQKKGVSLVVLPEFGPDIHLWNDFKTFIQFVRIIRQFKPDIVHTHTFKAGFLGRLAAFFCAVPIKVHTYHGHLLFGYGSAIKSKIWGFIERGLNLITDRSLGVSQIVARDLVEANVVPAQKMSVLELGFDLDYLNFLIQCESQFRNTFQIPKLAKVVAVAGRMVPVKGLDFFLSELIPLMENHKDLHLCLIGDGPLKADLQQVVSQHPNRNISSRIHFTGWIKNWVQALKEIDLYVCTSKNEGTSVAVIEAVMAGVPVISTAVGGMPDLLGNGKWGRLVERAPDQLRRSVEDALFKIKPDKDFLNAAAEYFRTQYSDKRLCSDLSGIYKELLLAKLGEQFDSKYLTIDATIYNPK